MEVGIAKDVKQSLRVRRPWNLQNLDQNEKVKCFPRARNGHEALYEEKVPGRRDDEPFCTESLVSNPWAPKSSCWRVSRTSTRDKRGQLCRNE